MLAGVLLVCAALLMWQAARAQAQGSVSDWSPAFKVSTVNGSVGVAAITGDAKGNIYVLWAGNSGGLISKRETFQAPDTIYLRAYDGSKWSDAIEVLAFPLTESLFGLDTFTLDAYGRLLLLWHRGDEVYTSTALPAQALRASNWRTVQVSKGAKVFGADLKIGRDGTLYIMLAGAGQNIYLSSSRNAGDSWQEASRISTGNDPNIQAGESRIVVGADGVLHVTWTEHAKEFNWTGAAIQYARSTDAGATWSNSTRLVNANGNAWSNLTTDDKGNLWLFWDRSVGSKDGRYYARSKDNGATWTRPILSYDSINISGMSGFAEMWWDSAGQLHLFNGGYGPKSSEIWESRWQGERWAEPTPVSTAGRLTGSEVFSAALVGGNRLLLAWVDFDTKDVWFTSKSYRAPATTDAFLDQPTPAPTAARTPTPSMALARPTRSASGVETTTDSVDLNQSSPLSPLVAGVLPIVGLLIVVILARLRGRS